MAYNWQLSDWPNFRYDLSGLHDSLLLLADRTGRASGLLQGLAPDAQVEAAVMIMVAEALKTSDQCRESHGNTRSPETNYDGHLRTDRRRPEYEIYDQSVGLRVAADLPRSQPLHQDR